jgi:hypothetical protein
MDLEWFILSKIIILILTFEINTHNIHKSHAGPILFSHTVIRRHASASQSHTHEWLFSDTLDYRSIAHYIQKKGTVRLYR